MSAAGKPVLSVVACPIEASGWAKGFSLGALLGMPCAIQDGENGPARPSLCKSRSGNGRKRESARSWPLAFPARTSCYLQHRGPGASFQGHGKSHRGRHGEPWQAWPDVCCFPSQIVASAVISISAPAGPQEIHLRLEAKLCIWEMSNVWGSPGSLVVSLSHAGASSLGHHSPVQALCRHVGGCG